MNSTNFTMTSTNFTNSRNFMNSTNSTMNSTNSTLEPFLPQSTEPSPVLMEHFLSYKVASVLWQFWPPVIVLLGAFGNVMSIVIMSRMASSESTVNMFFIVIAVADLFVLFSGMTLSTWLEMTLGLPNLSQWPLCLWLTPAAGAMVSWLLVSLTLQRVLAVGWPHHVTRLCTKRRVGVLIAGVAGFMAALYAHNLYCLRYFSYYYHPDPASSFSDHCISSSPDYAWFLGNVFSYVDMAVYSLLPFLTLLLGNSFLVWKLTASVAEARQRLTATTAATTTTTTMTTTTTPATNREMLKRSQDSTSVTITVLVVSLAFLLLTLPSTLFYVLYYVQDSGVPGPREEAGVFLFFTLSFLLADTNSAVNFYLYCLTGRRFRQEFVKIVCCWKGAKASRGNA